MSRKDTDTAPTNPATPTSTLLNARQVFEMLGVDPKKYKTHQNMVLKLHREGKIVGVRALGRKIMFTPASVEAYRRTCGAAVTGPPRVRRKPRKAKSFATREV